MKLIEISSLRSRNYKKMEIEIGKKKRRREDGETYRSYREVISLACSKRQMLTGVRVINSVKAECHKVVLNGIREKLVI
ncbi:MAG: hypothetical protein KAJ14_02580 [Candidatus Omnitrophica bacterium]|nr:hypothetical protein [Candidatus Omnitrophota bacterium]MCK5491979.1 hypothetical protein [Candidatus Omnitrophota bacterium]